MHASKSLAVSSMDILRPYLFNVKVDRIINLSESEDDNVQRLFNYRGCWIENLTPSGFDTSGSDPVTCTCSINFLEFEDLQSGLSDINANENTSSAMEEYKNTSYV